MRIRFDKKAAAIESEKSIGVTTDGATHFSSTERHYSPADIAAMWRLSVDSVRKIFEKEPGVLIIGNSQSRRGKRSYTTLRIPQTVLNRIHKKLSKV